ncbi:MAG TPA: hypothetical protein VJ961_09645 [Mariprofundaceae bacterium]|nr:hypothetical protein [Mariprofundaceae bacterium]
MVQHQLEAFIDELAVSEKAAAEKIRQAEAARDARLEALRQRLEKERQSALEKLRKEFAEEEKRQKASLQRRTRLMQKETDEAVHKVRNRHEEMKHELIQWGVDQVTRP